MDKNREKGKGKKEKGPTPAAGGALVFATQKAAADYAGVTPRTIRNWVTERNMPKAENGGYLASVLDLYKNTAEGTPGDMHIDRKNMAEAENKEIKTKLLALELAVRTGKLIDAKVVEAERVARIMDVKRVLKGLPRKLPPRLKGKSTRAMTKIINEEVEHCINVFAGSKDRE